MPRFGTLLQDHLHTANMTVRGLAARLKISPGFVSMVMNGLRTPPLDELENWSDALRLDGQPRQDFLRAAYLAHAPAEVSDLVDALDLQLAQAQTEIARLREDVDRYEARAAKPKKQRRPRRRARDSQGPGG